MRKSTLITTIAMIVVVVVALSTATYAWFTTATTSKATQQIATTADSGLSLSVGTINATTISWTQAATKIDLGTGLAGLYSPTGEITAKCSDGTQTATYSNDSSRFAQGTTLGSNANVSNADESNQVPKIDPTLINVFNGYQTAKNVGITILIDLGSDPADGSYYAASALTFYIELTTGTSDAATHKVFTLGYTPCTVAAGQVGQNASGAIMGTVATAGSAIAGANVIGGRPVYSTATTDSNFMNATGDDVTAMGDETTLTAGNKILVYNIPLAAVPASTSVNITLYSWVDGWIAKDHAKSALLSITYMFSVDNYAIAAKSLDGTRTITFGA